MRQQTFAQFVLQLDFSIVNVALPTIQRDLFLIGTGMAVLGGALVSWQLRSRLPVPRRGRRSGQR
jgi:MFS family permease